MRYIGNNSNLVRDAVLSALNLIASNAIYRTDTAPKVGGGLVKLTGPYTGQQDTTIDVQIIDAGGTPGGVSAPKFVGSGNGIMDSLSATGIDPQDFVVTLEDLGTTTRTATSSFQGASLIAKTPGAPGNLVEIKVDHSGLVFTPTSFSLQNDLTAGTNSYVGEEWNFGAAVLDAEGTIPITAPRISFGTDPQVYRAYKQYLNGSYTYGFSPAPVRDVAKGAVVKLVTGTRSISIDAGSTPETMSGIITLYDALSAIRDNSSLAAVTSPIVNDRLPGGMGITELSVHTSSYAIGVTTDGGDAIKNVELAVTGSSIAPTETLTIRCTASPAAGDEEWSVRGDVSGTLASATTGVAYNDGHYQFTIPLATLLGNVNVTGNMSVTYTPKDPLRELPVFSPTQMRIGAAATDGTWNFINTVRPPAPCTDEGVISGGPIDACLGIHQPGDIDVSNESSIVLRLQRLASAIRGFIEANTAFVANMPQGEAFDVEFITVTGAVLSDCLRRLAPAATSLPVWLASSAYAVDDTIEPTPANGYRYVATVAGSSGASQPTWPTTIGTTVTDSGVTWSCLGKTAFGMWDDVFASWKTDMTQISADLTAVGPYSTWAATTDFGSTGLQQFVIPTTGNGYAYRLVRPVALNGTANSSGSTEPTWPTTIGATVSDGDLVWQCAVQYWQASHATALNATITLPGNDSLNGLTLTCTTAGTTGTTEPLWFRAGGIVTDGSVKWASNGSGVLVESQINNVYLDRYKAQSNDVLIAGGIDSNFDIASANGDGCWQDFNDAASWWVYDGDEPYLPIQTGHYYHSTELGHDEQGKPTSFSTKEFGFGPKFACPDLIQAGDKLTIRISGAVGTSTGQGYQPGDEFLLRINHADPVPFNGGQTGNDTLTWSVIGAGDAGRLADYSLLTTAPPLYSDSGLEFLITPGGIPFVLGDQYGFSIEGGRFQWRQNGGSWTSTIDIADTALVSGLTATFSPGSAPSWVGGDMWSFKAEATNGADGIRQPTDAQFAWVTSTVISIAPTTTTAVTSVSLWNHTIPSDTTILLEGSNDNFSTSPLSKPLAWMPNNIWSPITGTYAKYRLTINRPGSIQWMYLGDAPALAIANGRTDVGKLTKRWRLPGLTVRKALGCTIAHTGLPETSIDALMAALSWACENDDNRFGILPNDEEPNEAALVEFDDASLEISDALDFGPRDNTLRLMSVSLTLNPAP